MADIKHEIKINAAVDTIYKAINTVQGLRAWHSSDVAGSADLNGILTFKGKDKPTFQWKVIKNDPEKQIVWECIEGPGDSKGTKASYKITKTDDGRSLVEFSHTEWPGEHGNFNKCNTLWGILLHHLKIYAESGKVEPTFR